MISITRDKRLVLLVFLLHVVIGSTFYYSRVRNFHPIFSSDFFVMGLPSILAFLGYLTALKKGRVIMGLPPLSLQRVIFEALIASGISFWITLIISLSTWGS